MVVLCFFFFTEKFFFNFFTQLYFTDLMSGWGIKNIEILTWHYRAEGVLSGGLETVTCFRTERCWAWGKHLPFENVWRGEVGAREGRGSAGWVSKSQEVQVSPVSPATLWGICVMGVGSYLSAQEGSSIYSQKFKVRLFLFSGYWGKCKSEKLRAPKYLGIATGKCLYSFILVKPVSSLLIERRNHSLEGHSRLWCMRDMASGYFVFAVYSLMHLGHFNKWVDTWW